MLKRLLLGSLAAAYLAFVCVQAAHFHKDAREARPDSCAVCVLAHQSVAQAPNSAPSLSADSTLHSALPVFLAEARAAAVSYASARAPPAAA